MPPPISPEEKLARTLLNTAQITTLVRIFTACVNQIATPEIAANLSIRSQGTRQQCSLSADLNTVNWHFWGWRLISGSTRANRFILDHERDKVFSPLVTASGVFRTAEFRTWLLESLVERATSAMDSYRLNHPVGVADLNLKARAFRRNDGKISLHLDELPDDTYWRIITAIIPSARRPNPAAKSVLRAPRTRFRRV